jgi:GNAT acetyltransferase-like protein
MVKIDRRLFGLLRYQTIFFPAKSALETALRSTELVRFFWTNQALGSTRRFLIRDEVGASILVDLTQSLDVLLKAMSQTARRKLRLAEKIAGLKIVRNGPDAVRDFLPLYNDFARAKQNGVSPVTEDVLQRYAPYSDLFLCYLDDRPVCGHLNLVDPDLRRSRLVYSANRRFDDPETARTCAIVNCHLHWHEMQAYREENLMVYDFGGYSKGANAGIDRFKESFGGTIVDEHTYLCAGVPVLGRLLLRLRSMISPPPAAMRSLPTPNPTESS